MDLAKGAITTLTVSTAGIVLGMLAGLFLALVRVGRVPIAAQTVAAHTSLARAAPMVTLALLVFFGLLSIGLAMSPPVAAIVVIAINTSAFQAEIWRASLLDFPTGQVDAARAVGMTRGLIFRRIVFPQVWRASMPAIANELTLVIKGSPAVAVIGVVDLTRVAVRWSTQTYQPIVPFLTAGAIYVLAVMCLLLVQRYMEHRIVERYGVL
ncbi:amino acid ABC transporter permease [Bradyrhizobium sp. SRL28]|uniref:amino acid ABC transporter permease n=1 Tax=Bradyrhizobium sp. SRL28 TaxID=2836178 RepID=UPI001BDE2773|nr:amino acid ABC transporter permease [Bradyrhizobium sp. SRL28]MBT1516539.1 amino acid ABC transporter permease [Bradyrhizobium sp. SRL28]